MTKRKHNIQPDTSLLEKIGATSFTLPEAIAELVANSIDARKVTDEMQQVVNIEIETNIEEGFITISDDGIGMTEEVLVNAMKLASSSDKLLGKRNRKGFFGLGLKTATASIGRKWSVLTRSTNSGHDYSVIIDLSKFSSSDSSWDIDVEEIKRVRQSDLKDRVSGTIVKIERLRNTIPIGATELYLANYFKPHIERGDVIIKVNGQDLPLIEKKILKETKKEFDIEIEGDSGAIYKIRGWFALDSQTNNSGNYGFNLYKNNQLIKAWDKSWIKTHLMASRVVGEAHLDYMPVNFNKQGFQTNTTEWNETAKYMTQFLKPIQKASSDLNTGKKNGSKMGGIQAGLNKAYGGLEKLVGVEMGPNIDKPSMPGEEDSKSDLKSEDKFKVISRNEIVLNKKTLLRLTHDIQDLNSEQTPWDWFHESLGNENQYDEVVSLSVVINTNGRLYKSTKDSEIIVLLSMTISLSDFLIKEYGYDVKHAEKLRNLWLFVAQTKDSNNDR